MKIRMGIGAAVMLGALVAAGCGDSGSTTTNAAATTSAAPATTVVATPTTTATPATTAAPATTGAPASGTTAVTLAKSSLGDIVADAQGRSLYMFLKDSPGKPSACTASCTGTWPAYTVTATSAATGIDASKLGTLDTTDGKKQLTINGMPLYHFAADSAPGDMKGQGIGGFWYVVDPTGTPRK